MRPTITRRGAILAAALAVAAIAVPATLDVHLPAPPTATAAAGGAAQRVFVDPDTGALRAPTPAELQAIARQTAKGVQGSVAEVASVLQKQGMTIVRVPASRQVRLTVHEDAQGHLRRGQRHE